MKVRDVIKMIEQDGWYWVRIVGSHHPYRHPTRPGTVTTPGRPGKDIPEGTNYSDLRQAGLK